MGSTAAPVYIEYDYPSCVPLSINVASQVWEPDPLWTWVAFVIAFVAAASISAATAPSFVRLWRRKQRQDQEEKVMMERGIPMHMRGKVSLVDQEHIQKTVQQKTDVKQTSKKTIGDASSEVKSENGPKPKTPSEAQPESMADVLLKQSEEAAALAIASQDLADVSSMEKSFVSDKTKAMSFLLKMLLQKLVSESKLDAASAKTFAKDFESHLEDDVKILDEGREVDEGFGGHLTDGHAEGLDSSSNFMQRLTKLFASKEDEIENRLKTIADNTDVSEGSRLSETEIDQHMAWFRAQMLNVEKKLSEETRRQLEVLDMKVARRRELSEVSILKKKSIADEFNLRVLEKKNFLESLVHDDRLTEEQAANILKQYQANAATLRQQLEAETARQEQELMVKVQRRRGDKLRRLDEQQQKARLSLLKQMQVPLSADPAAADSAEDPAKTVAAYLDLMQQQREEREAVVAELDQQEASEVAKTLTVTAQQDSISSDNAFNNILRNLAEISEKDIERLIALHQQRMVEVQRVADKDRKRANDKLLERLAQRQKKREEDKQKEAAERTILTQQQQSMVSKVLETQAELTEDACKQVLMEHERNINALTTQMTVNQRRQQAALESKMAERRAKLALRKSEEEASTASKTEDERKRIAAKIEAEEERIRVDHALAVIELRKRLAEETRQALLSQEERLSLVIGKLQVGQVRRKSILQRQDKLLAELQSQLADKLAKKKTSPSVADQLLQQHQNEVAKLTEQLETDKERQERMLQDKLERKKLLREQDIQQQMRVEAEKELADQRARGAGKAATVLFGMLLEQKHKKAMEDLEVEIQADLRKQRDEMNEHFETELKKSLDEQGKSFLATVAAVSDLTPRDINEAVQNAAQTVKAKDAVVRKLAREMKTEVTRAKSSYGERRDPGAAAATAAATDGLGMRRAKTDVGEKEPEARPRSAKPKLGRPAFDD